nr:transporter substrate-binding domain-containing protein [uncultured Roseateles sp.]
MRSAWTALLLCLPGLCIAACSRSIDVPVSTVGLSVTIEAGKVGGAYPSLLRELGLANGCQFDFRPVPRARLELMFGAGQADMIVPATRSERRDLLGEFVPLIQSRATAISLESERLAVHSLDDILQRKALRVVVVRGFDFGAEYRRFVEAIRAQGRLQQEADLAGLVRALQEGHADLTVLNATNLYGLQPSGSKPLPAQWRVEPLNEMPWGEAGFYISNKSLPPADRQHLRQMLQDAARNGAVWKALSQVYPAATLEAGMRPL